MASGGASGKWNITLGWLKQWQMPTPVSSDISGDVTCDSRSLSGTSSSQSSSSSTTTRANNCVANKSAYDDIDRGGGGGGEMDVNDYGSYLLVMPAALSPLPVMSSLSSSSAQTLQPPLPQPGVEDVGVENSWLNQEIGLLQRLTTHQPICSSNDCPTMDKATSYETQKRLVEFFGQHPMLKSFVAGSFSGTCSTLLFQPFDLLKTRVQNANFVTTRNGGTSLTATVANPTRISAIFLDVIKNEQIIGLWRGTVPSLMRCVPGVGLHFCCLDTLQNHFCSGRKPKAIEALAFGIASRSLAGVLLIPVTVVKTRYESGVFLYSGMTDAIRHTYRHEGVRGLTSGLLPTLLRDAPFSGLYYMFYTQLKSFLFPLVLSRSSSSSPSSSSSSSKKVSSKSTNSKASFISTSCLTFICGLNAGLMASVVTQPMDVVKTHMQLYPKQFRTSFSTVIFILQQKGPQGLFAGLVPRMLRRTLVASMAWTVYEQVMKSVGLK